MASDSPAPAARPVFLGREAELAAVDGALTRVRAVLVVGIPGIGKSALLTQAAARAAGRFRVVRPLLDPPGDLLEAFDRGLRLAGVTSFTACLRQGGASFLEKALTLFSLLRREPMLVVLDDLHALGAQEAARLLGDLAAHLGSSRVLAASRVRLATGLVEGVDLETIPLAGLPLGESSRLLDRLLGIGVAPADSPDETRMGGVARAAGGHPLSLKLAAGVMRAGGLAPSELAEQSEPFREELERTLLERLIASLSVAEKRLVGALSVFRGPAELPALDHLVGPEVTALASALEERFLVERPTARTFALHPLVRELCLVRLSEVERARLRGALADYFESRHRESGSAGVLADGASSGPDQVESARTPGSPNALVEAYHLSVLAGDEGRAYRLLLSFLDTLSTRGRHQELAPMIDRALATIFEPDVRLPIAKARLFRHQGRVSEARALLAGISEPAAPADQAALLAERGLLEQDAGKSDKALRHYYAALELAQRAGARPLEATLLARMATVCKDQSDYDRAIRLYEQALEIERSWGSEHGAAFALHNLAKIYYFQGEHDRALVAHAQAEELWRKAGDKLSVLLARNGVANILKDRGQIQAALDIYLENLTGYRALGNPFGESYTLANIGQIRLLRGQHAEARELLDDALRLSREMGNRFGEALVLDKLGELGRATGSFPDARDRYEAALKLKRELKNRYGIALTLNGLGDLSRETGDPARAMACYDEALTICRQLRDRDGTALALEGRGILHADRGEYAAARAGFREALALRRSMDEKQGIGRLLTGMGRLAAGEGEIESAFDLQREGLALFRRLENRREMQRSLGCLAQLHANLQEYEPALALASESLELARRLEDRRGEAVTLTQLGQLALHRGEPAEAVRWLEQSLTIRMDLGDRRGLVACLEPLALAYLEWGRYHDARRMLEHAIDVADSADFPRVALFCRAHLALVELRTGRLDEASASLKTLVEAAIRAGIADAVALLFRLSGFLACRRGQPEAAARFLRQSCDLYRKLRIDREHGRVERELEALGKDRLLEQLERRRGQVRHSARIDEAMRTESAAPLTAMVVDVGDDRPGLPPGIREDRRSRYRDPEAPLPKLLAAHGGKAIRLVGRALLATFDDARHALAAARVIKADAAASGLPGRGARIGIETGPLLAVGPEVFGEAVDFASRLQSVARPGQIVLGEGAWSALPEPRPPAVELDPQRMRGRAQPLRARRLD